MISVRVPFWLFACIMMLCCSQPSVGQVLRTPCKATAGWEIIPSEYPSVCDEQGLMQGKALATMNMNFFPTNQRYLIAEFKDGKPIGSEWTIVDNPDRDKNPTRSSYATCILGQVEIESSAAFSWKTTTCRYSDNPSKRLDLVAADRFKFDGRSFHAVRFNIEYSGPASIDLWTFRAGSTMSIRGDSEPWAEDLVRKGSSFGVKVFGSITSITEPEGRATRSRALADIKSIAGNFKLEFGPGYGIIRVVHSPASKKDLLTYSRFKLEHKDGTWEEVTPQGEGPYAYAYSNSAGYFFETDASKCDLKSGIGVFALPVKKKDESEEAYFLRRIQGCGEVRVPGKSPMRGFIDGQKMEIKPF